MLVFQLRNFLNLSLNQTTMCKQKLYQLRSILLLALVFVSGQGFAQTNDLVNDGDEIYIDGDVITVENGGIINQDNGGSQGLIRNLQGTVILDRDFINNSVSSGFQSGTQGRVLMRGGFQVIGGTSPTTFNTLELAGTGNKRLDQDIFIEDTLYLNDRLLQTQDNWATVENPNPNAIQRTTGYVESNATGRLVRRMNSTAAYLFPVGGGLGLFRPVEIQPVNSGNQLYAVRMAPIDATVDFGENPNGFDRNLKTDSICIVNPNYYHLIERLVSNGPVGISLFFDPSEAVNDSMVQWQADPNTGNLRWDKIAVDSLRANALGTLHKMKRNEWSDFSNPAFAMANMNPVAGFTFTPPIPEPVVLQPVTFTATNNNYDLYQWAFNDTLNGTATGITTEYTFVYPATNQVVLTVTDENGCQDTASAFIPIRNRINVFIPNAFTNNNDGKNDVFAVPFYEYEKAEMDIYARNGIKIFSTITNVSPIIWDGTIEGKSAPEDAYVYVIKVYKDGKIAET
ncbi:MAG: gliding motility-associated C-terminal domain-containing protein, partial [Bacteroidia bacterium]|nr:gliding motility-associated C-terminal domain-containing protein [Bacteroidia bacterium]